ncbi:hypothetical protein AAZX31_05G124700 [Glycine max]
MITATTVTIMSSVFVTVVASKGSAITGGAERVKVICGAMEGSEAETERRGREGKGGNGFGREWSEEGKSDQHCCVL